VAVLETIVSKAVSPLLARLNALEAPRQAVTDRRLAVEVDRVSRAWAPVARQLEQSLATFTDPVAVDQAGEPVDPGEPTADHA